MSIHRKYEGEPDDGVKKSLKKWKKKLRKKRKYIKVKKD